MIRVVQPPLGHVRLVLVALLASTPAMSACGADGREDRVVITDSAGIALVSNRGADVPLEWSFERRLALGGRESGPEAFYEASRGSVGVDSAGNIFVLDAAAHRVVVFDGEGNHLRTMGREGEGPGELADPWRLTVRPDGTAIVDDFGRGRFVVFAPDGTSADGQERRRGADRRVYGNESSYESDTSPDSLGTRYELKLVQGSDTTPLANLHVEIDLRPIELPSCGMKFSGMPPLFVENQLWDAYGSRLAVRAGTAYEIDIFEADRHVARVRRPVHPVPTTTELAVRHLGEAMRVGIPGGERLCDPVETVEQRGYEEEMPAIRDLRVDPAGRIWASRAGPRPEPAPTDILDRDGRYLGTIPASAPYPIGFLPDGRALATETDDVGIARLVIYAVVEVPSGFEPE